MCGFGVCEIPALPGNTQTRRYYKKGRHHYKKVVSVFPLVVEMLAFGKGNRYISRETGLAINTVRKLVLELAR